SRGRRGGQEARRVGGEAAGRRRRRGGAHGLARQCALRGGGPPVTGGRIVSLQAGGGGTLPYRGNLVRSGIDKPTVTGPLRVTADGVTGDLVVDLRVHGGPDKAICCFPTEHLAGWARRIGRDALPLGAFGENFSTEGLLETEL